MPLSILVVEDEKSVRTVIRQKLERDGHTVREAENGLIAERILLETRFDVALLDLIMPVRDGLETIRHIRSKYPALKIVAMSTPSSLMLLECAKLMGAHGSLAKPFTLADVEEVLAQVTGQPAQEKSGGRAA